MTSAPIDPRLWRYSATARRYLLATVALSVLSTAGTVLAALVIARILAGIVTDPTARELRTWTVEFIVLAAAVGVRVGAAWSQARLASRAGAEVVAELEIELLAAATRLSGRELDGRRGELAVLATTGLAALRPYLAGYLPALILAVLVPPSVLVVIAAHDLTSAGIVAVTLPLIPVFMILIGLLSKGKADESLRTMTRLADQMLDLFAGLPTLRALHRQHGPERRVAELAEAHRNTTLATLRIAFLSALVLELLATLCVALVAVSIGLRLVFGHMQLEAGLVALILAPEVYLPLRTLGERFHAADDGRAAADRAFAVIGVYPGDGPVARPPGLVSTAQTLELADVTVHGRDGFAPAGLSLRAQAGQVTVLTGANGAGKSTVLQVILGLQPVDLGRVLVGGAEVGELDRQQWWSRVGWLPQRPVLVPGTLRENAELLGARIDTEEFDEACAATGLSQVLDELPDRWATLLGAGGTGLSLGQRQRLALTRVLAAPKPVLLLDEPTAHLDSDSEAVVLDCLRRRAADGALVVMVGHRPTVLAAADVLVEVKADARIPG